MAIRVLEATQQTGRTFRVSGPVGQIILRLHQGGTWTLQVQAPDGEWVNTDIIWTSDGVQSFDSQLEWLYRLNGGNSGAMAWFTDYWHGRRENGT